MYGEDYNSIRRRNQSYFAGANPGAGNQGFPLAPGVAEGQARMNQIASAGTYKSRRDDFRNKYPQFANPVAQQNLQQFDIKRAYAQGYGAPSPTIQQGPGGAYRVAGGVAAPYNPPYTTGLSQFPGVGFLQRQMANLGTGIGTAFPAISQYLFGGRGGQYAGQSAGGTSPNQNYYAYNPSPMAYQPNRYFD